MLNHIIGSFAISFVNLMLWQKLLEQKVNYRNIRTYIGMAFMTLTLIGNFFLVNQIIKALTVIVIVTMVVIYMFKIPLKEAVVLAIVTQALYIISEVFVVILVLIVMNIQNKTELVAKFSGTIYANLIITALVYLIIQLPFVNKLYNKLILLVKKEKVYITILVVFVIIATASILFNIIFYNNNLVLVSFIGLSLLIFYLIFIIKNIIIRNEYLNMSVKYNNTLETLKSYEDILDKYKVSNHENKNQLLMIRNMLGKDTKGDVSKYIDNIVKNEYQDDENLIMETSKIPAGGLRALIYSKLLYMKNNDILFELKIDRQIRSVHLVDLNENLILDICKIVGVFLDNAIEECKKIKSGSLSIELYMMDDKFHISIANTFEGSIDLDKIDMVKYTTKGNEHGYGLALVKEIINKNSNLENVRMINDNVFIQILKISI